MTRPLCLGLLLCGLSQPAIGQAPGWLTNWAEQHELTAESLERLLGNPSAREGLTGAQAKAAGQVLWNTRRAALRKERKKEMDSREIVLGKLKMPFWYKVFGDKPEAGRSLYISMHGGGGAPARVNDQQYENQKRLYQPPEGVYLVPRAPTNTWNLWHQGHIDAFFDRLITNLVVFEDVNPDRVYIMGYSAGGDGVYQLAPRMADRWAAAAMMAGHPNEARPDNLRNIGFTLHMGGNDRAYRRNAVAGEWKKKLADLREADGKGGYRHEVSIHEGLGHWMNRKDAVAVPWMAKFTRNPTPGKVVWYQDDVTQSRFYWLAVAESDRKAGTRVVVTVAGNKIVVREANVPALKFLLSDRLLPLDKPVQVVRDGQTLYEGTPKRTVADLATTLLMRDDPATMASFTFEVNEAITG